MSLFHRVEDCQVIVRSKGRYYQLPLYTRNGMIYAKQGTSYVLLLRDQNTTHPDIAWEEIHDPCPVNRVTFQPHKQPQLAMLEPRKEITSG